MPLYEYKCECGAKIERIQPVNGIPPLCPRCDRIMSKQVSPIAMIRIKGQGLPARRQWMDNWTPGSPPFSTGSLHGARY